jgi:hypothetical protein
VAQQAGALASAVSANGSRGESKFTDHTLEVFAVEYPTSHQTEYSD